MPWDDLAFVVVDAVGRPALLRCCVESTKGGDLEDVVGVVTIVVIVAVLSGIAVVVLSYARVKGHSLADADDGVFRAELSEDNDEMEGSRVIPEAPWGQRRSGSRVHSSMHVRALLVSLMTSSNGRPSGDSPLIECTRSPTCGNEE